MELCVLHPNASRATIYAMPIESAHECLHNNTDGIIMANDRHGNKVPVAPGWYLIDRHSTFDPISFREKFARFEGVSAYPRRDVVQFTWQNGQLWDTCDKGHPRVVGAEDFYLSYVRCDRNGQLLSIPDELYEISEELNDLTMSDNIDAHAHIVHLTGLLGVNGEWANEELSEKAETALGTSLAERGVPA